MEVRDDTNTTPLFVDTSAFVAAYIEDDAHHAAADTVFDDLQTGESPYGPVFTTRYLLCEIATVIDIRKDYAHATTAIGEIRDSETINLLPVTDDVFADGCERFRDTDETGISLFDYVSGVVAERNGIEHVFGFDTDFATLGFAVVPDDADA
jgi:predicted nucleic acid-binding protein